MNKLWTAAAIAVRSRPLPVTTGVARASDRQSIHSGGVGRFTSDRAYLDGTVPAFHSPYSYESLSYRTPRKKKG